MTSPDVQSTAGLNQHARPVRRKLIHHLGAIVAGFVLSVIVIAVACADLLAPHDPLSVDVPNRYASPSLEHPLGTDMLGRDMASRLLFGGQYSLIMAASATTGILLLGVTLGVAAGVLGGAVDTAVTRAADMLQAIPFLILALASAALLGPGAVKLVWIFVGLGWPAMARVVRAATLEVRERSFIGAAEATGASGLRVITRHIMPNLSGPITVMATIDLGRVLLGLSALSFLGFGVQPPDPEWGAMMADARNYFYLAPRLLIVPGIAISIVALSVNLLGDGLRDALDVRTKGGSY